MFKKALKRTLPFTVGCLIGFAVVYTVMGILAEINPAFPPMRIEAVICVAGFIVATTCGFFVANVCFIKREDRDDET